MNERVQSALKIEGLLKNRSSIICSSLFLFKSPFRNVRFFRFFFSFYLSLHYFLAFKTSSFRFQIRKVHH